MSNKVEEGVQNTWGRNSLFGQFLCFIIIGDVGMGFDFMGGDVVQ